MERGKKNTRQQQHVTNASTDFSLRCAENYEKRALQKAEPGPRAEKWGTLRAPAPCPCSVPLPTTQTTRTVLSRCACAPAAALFLLLLRTIFMQQQHQQPAHPRSPHPNCTRLTPWPVCFCIFATFHSFCFVIWTRKQQTREGNGKRNKLRAQLCQVRKLRYPGLSWVEYIASNSIKNALYF